MMVSVETYLRRRRRKLMDLVRLPGVQAVLPAAGAAAGGFVLSAAAPVGAAQPLVMGLAAALPGWCSLAAGLGGMAGYRCFWGAAGLQGLVWSAAGCILGCFPGREQLIREHPGGIPAGAALLTAALGLMFSFLDLEDAGVGICVLRSAMAGLGTMLFLRRVRQRDRLSRWLCQGVLVLALAGICPVRWLNPAFAACGFFTAARTFPTAVMAGIGMDMARVTPIPMTAVVCCGWFAQRLTGERCRFRYLWPGLVYLSVMALWGSWEPEPLPGLLAGALLAQLVPASVRLPAAGSRGLDQVRLELAAGVMTQTQQLLLETPPPAVDEEALLEKVRIHACYGCSARKACREQEQLTIHHLRQPMDFACRKPGRIKGELRRGREQLYALRRDRTRQQEYRWALVQQYQFLAAYLRDLSDQLGCREPEPISRYRIRVSCRSRKKEFSNGDRCLAFPAGRLMYYVLLCDGMGTGLGAAREGQSASELLRQLITGGFPAEHALRSVNSILVLRGMAGAVTLDLAQVSLRSGKVVLYKWGAAPSLCISRSGVAALGSQAPPPGLSLRDPGLQVLHLSLCRGEALAMVSDGALPEPASGYRGLSADMDTGALAEALVSGQSRDDATAAVFRLSPIDTEAAG